MNSDSPISPSTPPVNSAAIDKLMAAHRLLGESRMIPTDTLPDQVTDQQSAEVISHVKAYLKEHCVSQAALAKALVYKPSTVSQVLGGKYNAVVGPIIIAMDRWLERRGEADKVPEVNAFVWTAVAERIRLAAKRAMAAADAGLDSRISLIWGDPGCGKSAALKAIVDRDGAILITCGVEAMSASAILRKIAEGLGLSALSSYRAKMFAEVVEALRGTGKLIIVDEIHALLESRDDIAFHTLRRLSDESGCPQLWCATCNLIVQLQTRETRREPLGQIVSRIGSQFEITAGMVNNMPGGRGEPLYTVEEILKIFARNELKLTHDSGRFLARLCMFPKYGYLRRCIDLVMHATTMNRGKATEITLQMLLEAAQFLFQNTELTKIHALAREEFKEQKLKLA